ncbi:MAG: ATP-dependent RNA helicase DbpA [Opitutales bacterium]|nr:ATP-dependent RNA helicase DbpA [Opitutales bacterium]MBT5816465.1 ATP-dependent RNA helicase DbpA [Opitutales bacterium]MBT6768079.1 ATP-dependent RNA helicase DbpA [Opitutales bacterium]
MEVDIPWRALSVVPRDTILKAKTFSSLSLQPELLKNIESLGYAEMTPIQAQGLPPILLGKDVIGQAKTGSGKTAAFGLGILAGLDTRSLQVQALVLCPTRELADQVSKAIRQLARMSPNVKILTLCGGMPSRPQVKSLEHGAHVVVGTPGRVGKHLRTNKLNLETLRILVLDEGDRMLEMGFQEEVDAVIGKTPVGRQTLLFSATYPRAIQSIAEKVMNEPVMAQVESNPDGGNIQQLFCKCGGGDAERLIALRLLLQEQRAESALVFCSTKLETQDVRDELVGLGYSAVALHGDLDQSERDETLVLFSNKSVSVLVATDVAARGLDIDSVDTVINYRMARDVEVHVHRIGRTGRAGSKGVACTLLGTRDSSTMDELESHFGKTFQTKALPPWKVLSSPIAIAPMATLHIRMGKRQKVRAGNILGLLTGKTGLQGDQIGKISVCDNWTYAAVARDAVDAALKKIATETWKGKPIKAWRMKE